MTLIKVIEAIDRRTKAGKGFTVIAVAEGAISKADAKLSKKDYKKKLEAKKYPSVAYEIAEEIQAANGPEVRITVPGHTQRGGSPCPYDRVLSTRIGVTAAKTDPRRGVRLYGRYREWQDEEGAACVRWPES